MEDNLSIYIDRLNDGKTQVIEDKILKTDFFEDEKDLKFGPSIEIRGKAYLTNDHLVLDIGATTSVSMPCLVCNQLVPYALTMEKQKLTIPLEEIASKIFSFKDLLRENLLLQLPQTIECSNGCVERKNIEQYLTKEKQNSSTHFPFSGLEDK